MSDLSGNVLVHTSTSYWSGEVVSCDGLWLKLRKAAWIADTGRYGTAMLAGLFNEVEPVPGEVSIFLCPGVVVVEFPHSLPRVQK